MTLPARPFQMISQGELYGFEFGNFRGGLSGSIHWCVFASEST